MTVATRDWRGARSGGRRMMSGSAKRLYKNPVIANEKSIGKLFVLDKWKNHMDNVICNCLNTLDMHTGIKYTHLQHLPQSLDHQDSIKARQPSDLLYPLPCHR